MKPLFKLFISAFLFLFTFQFSFGQTQQEKENIIVQMNYCINSLTNIANSQSMTVLNYEADQILNNLKLTDIRGERELQNFRTELFDAIRNLQITEKEKEILNRVQDLKRKKLMWNSLSNALNPAMFISGDGKTSTQIAFQAMVTAARTAVEYQAQKGENEIEEIQAMWALKKKELEKIGELRSNALKITFSLYDKYHFLGEWDRLTEETARKFSDITNEPKASKRVRQLKENEEIFKMLPEYYYHLGMALLGDNPEGKDANYAEAKVYLDKYLEKYGRTPIFRYDQKSGIIALTKLAYEPSLPKSKKIELIETAISNLPDNGSAVLQCALVYILELGEPDKGYELLRSGLDNNCSNSSTILSTISLYIDDIKQYPLIYSEIISAVNDCKSLALNEYIPFVISNDINNAWESLSSILTIEAGPCINIIADRHFDCSGISVYKVNYSSSHGNIRQQELIPENSFTNEILNKKVKAFSVKGNENLKYVFVDPIILGERYCVKKNLDYNNIRKGEFQGSNVFTISDSDIGDIIEFCEKNETGGTGMKILLSKSKKNIKISNGHYSLIDQYHLASDSLCMFSSDEALQESDFMMTLDYVGKDSISFIPAKLESTAGDYLVVDFDGIASTTVTYKKDRSGWIPFSIEKGGLVTYRSRQEVLDPGRDGVILSVWKRVKSIASSTISKIVDTFSSCYNKIKVFVKNAVDWTKDVFQEEMPEQVQNSDTRPEIKEDGQNGQSFIERLKFWKK